MRSLYASFEVSLHCFRLSVFCVCSLPKLSVDIIFHSPNVSRACLEPTVAINSCCPGWCSTDMSIIIHPWLFFILVICCSVKLNYIYEMSEVVRLFSLSLGSHSGPLTAEYGARTPTMVALLPQRSSGDFYQDSTISVWWSSLWMTRSSLDDLMSRIPFLYIFLFLG